jgi:transcriptional regulator with XRE-family HTH domain
MNENEQKKIPQGLGEKIKAIRLQRNLKIIDVSRKTGLSSSMISQVERSLISPSIDTLKKIGEAINIPVSFLFEDYDDEIKNEEIISKETSETESASNIVSERSVVVRLHQRKVLSPGPGVTFYLLNPDLSGPIEFIYNIYEPGTGTGNEQYSHPGHECGLILEGELHVSIGDKEYILKKGDSITFSCETPHSKSNRGSVPCICIWANTPPYF